MFAKLLGWAMHVHSYLERDRAFFFKVVFMSAVILLDALWVDSRLSKAIPFQRSYVLFLRYYRPWNKEMTADHCFPELNIQ